MVEHDLAKVGVAGSTPVSRSILVFFALIFFTTTLFAKTVTLKPLYLIDSNRVTLSDLGEKESNLTILELPEERTLWKVPAFRVAERLKERGYECDGRVSGMITFKRVSHKRYPKLRKLIAESYSERYPTLKIEKITVEPTGSGKIDFEMKPECSVRLTKSALRRESSTFTVRCKKRVYYFKYSLDGRILVYKANHQIKKDRIIDSNSVRAEYIPFRKFYAPPVTDPSGGRYIARLNIPASEVLTEANTEPVPAVLKNGKVKCIYKTGSVVIEFEATALKNGTPGEIVPVKKSDGKILRGRVVDNLRVEIE